MGLLRTFFERKRGWLFPLSKFGGGLGSYFFVVTCPVLFNIIIFKTFDEYFVKEIFLFPPGFSVDQQRFFDFE